MLPAPIYDFVKILQKLPRSPERNTRQTTIPTQFRTRYECDTSISQTRLSLHVAMIDHTLKLMLLHLTKQMKCDNIEIFYLQMLEEHNGLI